MDENRRLDEDLADLTDAVIENRETKTSEDMAELSAVVRGLRDLIESGEQPSALFEARMRQRLDLEWEQRQRRMLRPRVSNAVRVASLAAALVVVLVVVISLFGAPEDGGLQGTALGSPEGIIVVFALAAVVGLAVLLWRRRR
jgi:hypothetical protein